MKAPTAVVEATQWKRANERVGDLLKNDLQMQQKNSTTLIELATK